MSKWPIGLRHNWLNWIIFGEDAVGSNPGEGTNIFRLKRRERNQPRISPKEEIERERIIVQNHDAVST